MSDSQYQLSTKGPYYPIPGIKQLEMNSYGFIREIETGKMIPPSRIKGYLYYCINRYKSTWPDKVRRAVFMKKLGFTPQIKYDGNELYNEIRNRCFHINRKLGFATPKQNKKHEQKQALKRKKPTSRPKKDAQGIKQCLTDRPCKDGRSSHCFLYLPEGFWARCPACWAELRETEGYDQVDFSGYLGGKLNL